MAERAGASDQVRRYILSHLWLFAIPSTVCLLGATAKYSKTQNFAALVGERNAAKILGAMVVLCLPLLSWVKKLRVLNYETKDSVWFKTSLDMVILFAIVGLNMLQKVTGDPYLVLLVGGWLLNLADFAWVGHIGHRCNAILMTAATIAMVHSDHSWLVFGVSVAYSGFRFWVFEKCV